jgi:NAD(P)-dependent dehydrogenase (short-subunit alcohol dehydrogenase family)
MYCRIVAHPRSPSAQPEASSPSALITGGATGIGYAVAEDLCEAGYDLTLVGRRVEMLEAAHRQLRERFPARTISWISADLNDEEAPAMVVGRHVEQFGGISALIAAAAVYEPVPFLEVNASNWNQAVDGSLRGVVLAAASAARAMVPAGGGRIILIGSTSGFHAEPGTTTYSAVKAAIASVARGIAADLADQGIVANVVAPGWTRTPMTMEAADALSQSDLRRIMPAARVADPREVANVVRYLVVGAPSFLNGSTIYVDGGQTGMAPIPPS